MLVSPEDIDLPIVVLDPNLQEQAQSVAVIVALLAEPDYPTIPTIPERDANSVPTLAHVFGYIISLVLDPLVVGGPAWREEFVTDAAAVDSHLIETTARDVGTCRPNRLVYVKDSSEQHRRL